MRVPLATLCLACIAAASRLAAQPLPVTVTRTHQVGTVLEQTSTGTGLLFVSGVDTGQPNAVRIEIKELASTRDSAGFVRRFRISEAAALAAAVDSVVETYAKKGGREVEVESGWGELHVGIASGTEYLRIGTDRRRFVVVQGGLAQLRDLIHQAVLKPMGDAQGPQ